MLCLKDPKTGLSVNQFHPAQLAISVNSELLCVDSALECAGYPRGLLATYLLCKTAYGERALITYLAIS